MQLHIMYYALPSAFGRTWMNRPFSAVTVMSRNAISLALPTWQGMVQHSSNHASCVTVPPCKLPASRAYVTCLLLPLPPCPRSAHLGAGGAGHGCDVDGLCRAPPAAVRVARAHSNVGEDDVRHVAAIPSAQAQRHAKLSQHGQAYLHQYGAGPSAGSLSPLGAVHINLPRPTLRTRS